jgi:hypothetical protein
MTTILTVDEDTWDGGYIAELYRLGDLLDVALTEMGKLKSPKVGRPLSVVEVVRERVADLADRIECDAHGWSRNPAGRPMPAAG